MFNKETEYALRGLVYIQQQNYLAHRPGITEIAREIEAPQHFTAKVLQRLVRIGFLESQKGRGGGFYFPDGKPELSIRELIVAVEGEKTLDSCGFGLKHCDSENPCPIHYKYAPIRNSMNQLVMTETIQSLARGLNTNK